MRKVINKPFLVINFFFKIFLLFALPFLLRSCRPEDDLKIMTVNGTVFSSDMGTTLIHEHVMADWIGADCTGHHRWNRE